METDFDFLVIGGGSAGYAAASTAAALGLRVAVVEGGIEIGGLCILRGCMPSKTLIESANRYMTLRRAWEFGLRADNIAFDTAEIAARKKRLVAEFADYRREQLQSGRFKFIRGSAAFVDPHTVEITPVEGERWLATAKTCLVATGSCSTTVNIPGLIETGFCNSDQVLEWTALPESAVILGAGATALEFAHYLSAFEVKVTIIQRSSQVLTGTDRDVADCVAEGLRKRGVRIFLETKLVRTEVAGAGKRVVFFHEGEEKSVEAEEIIYALGRTPNLSGMNLAGIGAAENDRRLIVNARQQTALPHIFGAGDVVGPYEIVHIAIQQGEVVARNAARLIRGDSTLEELCYRLKLFAIFSSPEVATVGASELELLARGVKFLGGKYPFADHGKSLVMGECEGFVKLLVAEETREILGAAVVGPKASELIHEVTVAMHFHATANDLAQIPHYHPTLSEIWTYPAEDLSLQKNGGSIR